MKHNSKLDSVLGFISDNQIVKVIRWGLLYNMPLIMVGALVIMVLNLPIVQFSDALTALFGENWQTLCLLIHKGTYRIMSLSTLLAVSYSLVRDYNDSKFENQNHMITVLTALACYVIISPETGQPLDETYTGTTSMLRAIVVALLASYLFLFLSTHLPRRKKLYTYNADALLVTSLSSVVPVLLTIAAFALARIVIDVTGLSSSASAAGSAMLEVLFQNGRSLWTVILYCLLSHLLWFIGIHGTNIMESIAQELFVTATDTNLALVAAGAAPTEIFTKEFMDVFIFMGGAGCTLGLLIALFLTGHISRANGIAHYSIFPGIFNINESIVYGLPIIFNPYYIIPFLATPIALGISSFIAFSSGLVPLTTVRVAWTTPIFISGYVSTGSVAGLVLQVVNLVLSILIYFPFVRLYEKQMSRNNAKLFQQITQEYDNVDPNHPPRLLERNDEIGVLVRALASELREALSGKDIGLYMAFQPKSFSDGTVFGAEALLRWNHPRYGHISPPVTLGIANEAGLTIPLGTWVLEASLAGLTEMHALGYMITLSVNLSPNQIRTDELLPQQISDSIQLHKLDPSYLELELTEHTAMDQSQATRNRMEQLKALGVSISIDDFGMGSSSLLYLRDFYANIVKLDLSLVQTLDSSQYSQEIVRSIVTLCGQLKVELIAEGVETQAQLQALQAMGCYRYQGWYFSKALPLEDFLEYAKAHGVVAQPPHPIES